MGSAHDQAEVTALKATAAQRLAAGQAELDLRISGRAGSSPLPITSWRAAHLWDALRHAYAVLGFHQVADDVFRGLITLTGETKAIDRDLEARARTLAGWKGYTTNLTGQTPKLVIDAYHRLWRIEKSFRTSKHDL